MLLQPAGAALLEGVSLSLNRERRELDAARTCDVCLLCQRGKTEDLAPGKEAVPSMLCGAWQGGQRSGGFSLLQFASSMAHAGLGEGSWCWSSCICLLKQISSLVRFREMQTESSSSGLLGLKSPFLVTQKQAKNSKCKRGVSACGSSPWVLMMLTAYA